MKRLKLFPIAIVVVLLAAPLAPSLHADQLTMDATEAIVQRLYSEVYAKGNLDLIDEIAAPGFVNHHDPDANGIALLKAEVARLHDEWTVLSVTVQRVVTSDNLAVVEVRFEVVTHPTIGFYGWWTEYDILRLENGKLADLWCDCPLQQMLA